MSIERFCPSCVETGTDRAPARGERTGRIVRWLAVSAAAASLAACAQSSSVTQKSGLRASRTASLDHDRAAAPSIKRRVAATRKQSPSASRETVSHGVASFYTEGTKTASGEKFDTTQMTAAHPTLPFGTRLRVTDVGSGKSVTVRVNDRGPFVPGRVVDVSYSAASALGMVGKGVANVKLDVVD
ncbi:MAG: septal ring lytic transglycosylase RlpA family protein [bacterium]|nr:septal ring lytic transglycosylase RlpA family protein [bacterium]